MERRRFLATSLALLTGCTTTNNTTTTSTNDTTTTRKTTRTTAKRTVSRLPEQTTSKSKDAVASSVTTLDCAKLPPNPDVCPDTPDKLEIARPRPTTELSNDELSITLTNKSNSTFEWNPYDWTIYTRGNGAWQKLAPVMIPAPIDKLPPGESHTYTLTCTNSELLGINSYRSETQITLYGLGPGPLALTTTGAFDATPDTNYTAGAIFGFHGTEPPIKPTTHVTSTEIDDDTLTITTKENTDTYLQLDFIDATPDYHLLDNHVRQTRGLRNTLSYTPTAGISTIRYHDTESAIKDIIDYLSAITPQTANRYQFRDYTFKLTTNTTD